MTLPTRPRKRKPQGRQPENALTIAFVRNVVEARRYLDSNGLYLGPAVRPPGRSVSGTLLWVRLDPLVLAIP